MKYHISIKESKSDKELPLNGDQAKDILEIAVVAPKEYRRHALGVDAIDEVVEKAEERCFFMPDQLALFKAVAEEVKEGLSNG